MHIQKVHIIGFRCFKDIIVEFNENKNIIVGDNGTGKSTILDAIHLCLKGVHRGLPINTTLSPFLFNQDNVKAYLNACHAGNACVDLLPRITIEVFLAGSAEDSALLASCEGDNNTTKEGTSGIRLDIMFNEEFQDEYTILAQNPNNIKSIPIEYYHCIRQTFARGQITSRSIPICSQLIDSSAIVNHRGTIDVYLNRIINDRLDTRDRVALSGAFRQMKENFSINGDLTRILDKIETSETNLSLTIDPSVSTNWESLLIAKVNSIPFNYIGKGEQCMTKTHLVLDAENTTNRVLLLEEPENHLSYGSLHSFISHIEEKNASCQIIMTTHSSMVCNRLDLGNLILLGLSKKPTYFKNLDKDTRSFFQKVSGFDTLRIVVSPKSILVEGPSDDLIVQKTYYQEHQRSPLEDNVDIISVSGLSFKRYVSLVQALNNRVAIVTDNDGKSKKKEEWYRKYPTENIQFFFSSNDVANTLETQIIVANKENLSTLKMIVSKSKKNLSEDELDKYMKDNKTDCALAIFDSDDRIIMPDYIVKAVQWIKTDS